MCSASLLIHKADNVDSVSKSSTHDFALSPQLVKKGISCICICGSAVTISGRLARDADLVLNIDGGGGTLDETTGRPLYFTWQGAEKTYADINQVIERSRADVKYQ